MIASVSWRLNDSVGLGLEPEEPKYVGNHWFRRGLMAGMQMQIMERESSREE